MPTPKDHHQPKPLYGGDAPQAAPAQRSSRQPAGEIIRIPTSPSDWTRKDKRVISSAVSVGVFTGLLVWSVFAFLFTIGFSMMSVN